MRDQIFDSFNWKDMIQSDSEFRRGTGNRHGESTYLDQLTESFSTIKKNPTAWKWLWHSQHKDAKNIRCTMYLLINWPFDAIPWCILIDQLKEVIEDISEEINDAQDTEIDWFDPANHVNMSDTDIGIRQRQQTKREGQRHSRTTETIRLKKNKHKREWRAKLKAQGITGK
jgi:hypothetical protein